MSAAGLGSVQKTMLLPLWGRAVETRKPHPMLVDQAAARIAVEIGIDFADLAARMSFVTQLAWVVRCIHTDRTLGSFLARHPDATVVNMGCGLDTTFERVDNGRVQWFDLDMPDVIALRQTLIPETARRRFLAASLLDPAWLDRIDRDRPVFLFAMGVFYYIPEERLKALLQMIAGRLPSAELLFDACSPFGLKTANQRVIRDSGMQEG